MTPRRKTTLPPADGIVLVVNDRAFDAAAERPRSLREFIERMTGRSPGAVVYGDRRRGKDRR
jgi:hypothetical protein